MHRKFLSFLVSLLVMLSQLTISTFPVQAYENYSLNNGYLQFHAPGTTDAINASGSLNQPFYHSSNDTWYPLTYSSNSLNFAMGVGQSSAQVAEWNTEGTILTDVSLTDMQTDGTQLTTSNGLTYGKLIVSGTLDFNGSTLLIENTYELPQGKNFVKITTKLTNQSATVMNNVRYWVGTRDDWIGQSDVNTKEKGNIVDGNFTLISTTTEKAKALRITSGNEGVLFYTDNQGANMVVNRYGDFRSNIVSKDPVSTDVTTTNDGSYGMFLRLNDLQASESQQIVWYYAAGAASDLATIVRDVASAASSFANISYHGASFSVTSTVNSTGYYVVIPHGSPAPTADQIIAGADYGSTDVVLNGTQALSANVAGTFSLSGLTQGASYDVYFVTRYTDADSVVQTTAVSMSTLNLVAYGAPVLAATGSASSITKTSATVAGEVTSDNSEATAPITDRGLCFATSGNPTLASGTCVSAGSGLGTFSADLTSLQSYTTYYVRAYATNSYGTSYGAQSSFRTLERTLSTSLSGLSVPVTGASRPTSFSGTGYTARVVWSPASADGKFHAGTSYTATITLTPTTGYDLNGIAANSFTLSGVSSLSHDADSGVLSVRYPSTLYNEVVFETNGGSSIGNAEVDYGAQVPVPNQPTKRGYAFDGWYTDNTTFLNAYDFTAQTMGNQDLTLYAKWVIGAYTLSFDSNGGSYVAPVAQNALTALTAPTNPTREGYTFLYWSESALLDTPYVFDTMPADDVTLHAKWQANGYTLSYDVAGGNGLGATTFTINDAFTLPIPTRLDHTFTGWLLEGQPINSLRRGTIGDLTVVATWQRTLKAPVLGSLSVTGIGADSISIQQTVLDRGYPALTSLTYELVNVTTNEVIQGSLGSDFRATINGLVAYQGYHLYVILNNGTTRQVIDGGVVMPKLTDTDNDGIPDVRDAYPEDASKSMDVTEFNPDKEPSRALIGEKPDAQATEYQLKISSADLMGLERNDNILVVMGSVQFVIPVAMVDSIIANTGNPDAYLTLRVEPQVSTNTINSNILLKEGMDLIQAYDYKLFQIYPDGSEEAIHQLGGQIKVGIGLAELQGEYDPTKMEVYYYNSDDGTIQTMKAVYDPVTQSMVFMTEHFSYYVLGVKKEDDPAKGALQVIGLAMGLGVALFSLWGLIFKRRKQTHA